MKTRSILTIAVLAASISTNVLAKSPDWNFIQAGYSQLDIENSNDISPAGLTIGGSKLLGKNIFVVGDYSILSDDFEGLDVDLTQASLGFGYRHALTSTTDIYGVISYEYIEVESSVGNANDSLDENSMGLTAGIRSRLNDQIELDASISYVDFDYDGDDEVGFGVTANYFFTQNIAVGVGYSSTGDFDNLGISARYVF